MIDLWILFLDLVTITWGWEATNMRDDKGGSMVKVEMVIGEDMSWIGFTRGIESMSYVVGR